METNINNNKKIVGSRLIKGFIIGTSMLIPGASGGTMAIILGIYDELIHGVSSLKEDVVTHGSMLLQYGIPGILGIVLFSGPLLSAVNAWHKPMMFLFLGAIAASIFPLYRKAAANPIKWRNLIAVVIGAGVSFSIVLLPEGLFELDYEISFTNLLLLLVTGVVLAVALVLPGISASYFLLMLGIYDLTLEAISSFNVAFLLPIVIGTIGGTFLCADILDKEMKKHPQFTYMLIIGFVLESLREVFPGLPSSEEAIFCIITLVLGFGAVYLMGRRTV